jgi:phosphoribosylaminoimidazolecarboxamide formyltransferase/IMP cyclohydrolase
MAISPLEMPSTIAPGKYLVSDIELLQSGKHPGKTNLTDADNALNIIKIFYRHPLCRNCQAQ